MDFLRRVFNKSGSNPEIIPPLDGSGDSSLFGGLEVNELDQVEESDTHDSPVHAVQGSQSSAFTSEFSFLSQNNAHSTSNEPPQNERSDIALPSESQTSSEAVSESKPSSSPRNLKKSGSPKSTTKKTTKSTSSTPSSPSSSSSASTTPKKRIKKRTLENRPGYAASEGEPVSESGKESKDQNSAPVSIQTPNPDAIPSSSHIQEKEAPDSIVDSPEELHSSPKPDDPSKLFESLQLDHESQLSTYRSALHVLSEDIKLPYLRISEVYDKVGALERLQMDLRLEVKEAELEENFERAADLNAQIVSNRLELNEFAVTMEIQKSELRRLEASKVEILKSFATAQVHHCHQLDRVKTLQNDIVKHIDSAIVDLESETTTVFASKIELLSERLSDVESELARILEREQKVEAKIIASAQGLVETIQEDEETAQTLENEVKKLRATLAAKEAQFMIVQARLKANQNKVDALRKEQGDYLEDILSDQQKKTELLNSLRLEKSHLDSQMVRQYDKIDLQKQQKNEQMEIQVAIGLAQEDFEKMIKASQSSIVTFSTPVIQTLTSENTTSTNSDGKSLSNSDNGVQADTSKRNSISIDLDELKSLLSTERNQLDHLIEQIAAKNGLLQGTRSEIDAIRTSQPLLEQSKQAAVATRDYKEAARLKTEIALASSSLDQKTRETEELSSDVQNLQTQLIAQQTTIGGIVDNISAMEAKHAELQMAELDETRKLIIPQLKALRAASGSRLGSLLHDDALLVSISQLEGMGLATYSEQKFLALKFGLTIPELPVVEEEDKQVLEEAIDVADPSAPSVEEPNEAVEIENPSLASEAGPVPVEESNEEESSGLFDGLEESEVVELAEAEKPVEEISLVDNLTQALEEEKALENRLAQEIQALEAQLAEAEAQEDYEFAATLQEQLEALKSQVGGLNNK